MVCEHILCQDDRYYHQNGWLDYARENEAEIKVNISDASTKYQHRTQDFFGDWCSYKITAMLAIIWAASSSNICSGNTCRRYSKPQCQSAENHFKEFASVE